MTLSADRSERNMPGVEIKAPEVQVKATSGASEVNKPVQAKGSIETGAGVLSITSDPAGALVFIDGERRGVTPTRLTGLPTDREFDLRLEAEGFRLWQQKMQIDQGTPVRHLEAVLSPQPACPSGEGWLYVSTEPKGAIVELDGRRMPGTTPMIIDKVCAGQNHTLRLQAIGHRVWLDEEVKVPAGEVKNIDVTLKK